MFKSLLVAALTLSATHVKAHTNKTYLNTRSHGVNLALENSGGFKELVHRQDKNKFGGTFQASFFYNNSSNNNDLAKYFLTKNKNEVTATYGNATPNADRRKTHSYTFRSCRVKPMTKSFSSLPTSLLN